MENPDIILDGELYKHGVPLQVINGEARRHGDMYSKDSWLEYHVYDIVDPLLTQRERFGVLDNIEAEHWLESKHVKFVGYDIVNSMDKVKEFHDIYVSEGYEGAIVLGFLHLLQMV